MSLTQLDLYEARLHLNDLDYLLTRGYRQPRPAFLGFVLAFCFVAAAIAPWVLR